MPGSVLRRLITPRPRSRDDDSGLTIPFDQEATTSRKKSVKKKAGSQSWITTGRKKRSASNEDAENGPFLDAPFSLNQPSSSVYSLMPSHEARREAFPMAPPPIAKSASTLCLPEQGGSPQHSSQLRQPPNSSDGLPMALKLDIPGPSLSFSVLDFDHSTPTKDAPNKESPVESKNTDELVVKADEATDAIETAPTEVMPASRPSEEVHNATPPLPPLKPHKHSESMPLPIRYNKNQKPRDSVSPSSGSPARRSSVKKPKGKQRSSIRGALSRGSQIRGPRSWAISENVTDILTGQRFKRIEADEMLTPERLEEMRRSREQARIEEETRSEARDSSDSGRSIGSEARSTASEARSSESETRSTRSETRSTRSETRSTRSEACSAGSEDPETPLEPFHLESLSKLIEDAEMERGTFLDDPSPCSPLEEEDLYEDFEYEEDEYEDIFVQPLAYRPKFESETVPNVTSTTPLPPLKNPARYGTLPLQHKPLPQIPLVMLTEPDGKQSEVKRRRSQMPNLKAEERDGIIYFHSTPFTFNSPMFEHGPITFVKADICRGLKCIDETLDWTAFQMAILCGAGDLSPDMSWEEDRKQADDITDWFDSFGFETHGEMTSEDKPVLWAHESLTSTICSTSLTSSVSTPSSSPSTVNTEIDLPMPMGSEHPSGFWNPTSQGTSSNKGKFFDSPPKRWAGEGNSKRYMSRDSTDSLPPSPMLPLVVYSDDGAKGSIPMGYNLHHDLGDFLRWEAENVYAGEFSG